jgi:hypothetical protein
LFLIAFKLSVPIVLALYIVMRLGKQAELNISAQPIRFFFLSEIALFFVIAATLANRTDVVALTLGICMFEYAIRTNGRTLFGLAAFAGAVFYGLTIIEKSRFENAAESFLYEAILFKDYFAPAHILMAAINHQFVDPLEVLKSNVFNALFQVVTHISKHQSRNCSTQA